MYSYSPPLYQLSYRGEIIHSFLVMPLSPNNTSQITFEQKNGDGRSCLDDIFIDKHPSLTYNCYTCMFVR